MKEILQETPVAAQVTAAPKKRLLSLDFFRGLTVAAMILVNTPGNGDHVYAPLEHSKWDGCTPTDLVFPAFLFMVGVSIVYALEGKKTELKNHQSIMLNALRRMLILIGLGLSIFLFYRFDFTHLRFPGVLQRIGVVYFIATCLYLKTNQRTRDWLCVIILVSYYLVMKYLPVPDGHAANFTPQFNLAAWLDRAVFTTNHMARFTGQWDPVGLLTTWPAIATALLGIRMGTVLKDAGRDAHEKCAILLSSGICAIALGMVANQFFPINKQLWSSSYVLYAAGICTVGLTAAFYLIDVEGYKKHTWIFSVFGVNAISAYVLSEVMPRIIDFFRFNHNGHSVSGMKFFYEVVFLPFVKPNNASLLAALVFVAFIWLMMHVLYRRKIVIKI
ncbi:acyltransferase family protein [Mucilaginibacter sp. SP1R1]|uniref:acyltransferase family protein n=1 Tax=Mucilaginibacter sp. SP1R1 TaxID=2723091 RepID=UPI00160D3B8F|nr:heparan-alpha-glucosaminide N-acetyltransferase domain-containing protein [Mucilaginibacter sp. SP1R1]MBB6149959.1 putative acyltransferase [Mucilaginibacter sp. SP1R1]